MKDENDLFYIDNIDVSKTIDIFGKWGLNNFKPETDNLIINWSDMLG